MKISAILRDMSSVVTDRHEPDASIHDLLPTGFFKAAAIIALANIVLFVGGVVVVSLAVRYALTGSL